MPAERISFTIESELLGALDSWIEGRGHGNRSEGVRDLIRERLSQEVTADEKSDALGSLTLLYSHSQRQLTDKLVEAGHKHHHHVISSMHVHLDHELCLEVLALRGKAGHLRALAEHMGGMKGVVHYGLVLKSAAAH
jgi:CopG family nickel-responsive transcriptional regulator